MSSEVETEVAESQRQQPQTVQVQVKDEDAIACYANFCRVTGSPEELIVDFGLNPQPVGIPKDPIHVKQRIIMNSSPQSDCWLLFKCRYNDTKQFSAFSKQTFKSDSAFNKMASRRRQQWHCT